MALTVGEWGEPFWEAATLGNPREFCSLEPGRATHTCGRPNATLLFQLRLNHSLAQHSTDSIFITDPDGRITYLNPQAERVFGFACGELVGKRLEDTIHQAGSQSDGNRKPQGGVAGSEGSNQDTSGQEHLFVHKDGSALHGRCFRTPLELEGRRVGTLFLIHNLTEQKRAEQAGQETQLRLTALIDSALDGIIVVDSAQRIVMCNPAAERMFKYPASELVGKPIACLLPDGPPGCTGAWAQKSSPGTSRWPTGVLDVLTGLCSTGERFPLEASISHVELGSREFFTLILRDISERRRAEKLLAESEERFRQSQKMEAIGQLAGGVAHDFNNLLTVISGHAELLLARTGPQDRLRDSLSEIRKASSRATSLTRQLLAFSRKQILEPKLLDLNELITETEKMLRRLIGENISLRTLLAPDLRPIKADPGQIDQVILNLVVNARDAMAGGGKLTLETLNVELDEKYAKTRPDARPGNHVVLVVNDTGCGMTPGTQARIFEPFFTTKSAGQGTGLGLAVVHGIVKQSGGHIVVRSDIGVGTTFKLYFPSAAGTPAKTCAQNQMTGPGGCESILLVEDEEALRKMSSLVLESYGYTVWEAANAAEALRLVNCRAEKTDLLLTDLVMPGMSGSDLAKALRTRCPSLKVLFVSGYTEDAVVRQGIQQGSTAFLQKPFSPSALASKVRQILDGR